MGPTLPISRELMAMKYLQKHESFEQGMRRIASTLADDKVHEAALFDILVHQRFLPGGRIQASVGSARATTAFNCFVSGTIEDSMEGIMQRATEAAVTMRMGGGIGYDFSTLRPRGDLIRSLDSSSSGPISFMGIFNSVCNTISSAGHRRGAQMAVLRVDHPSIEEFVSAKRDATSLTAFNISVGVTDEFMDAVRGGRNFDLRFAGRVYKTVDARALWNEIMRSTWDWAEPGVLFIDRINAQNNLRYCETITATNPCSEQPLPPYGACLLGSFNLTAYGGDKGIDQLEADIPHVVRAMDNVVDRTIYPLPMQAHEALSKRRMGLGVTGLANFLEMQGMRYGDLAFVGCTGMVLGIIKDGCYRASALLAKEKRPFPAFIKDKYINAPFIMELAPEVRNLIAAHGIRNSHLLSIAPTGTISLTADNISSGIEPVFAHEYTRKINTPDGVRTETIGDWGLTNRGVRGKIANECSIDEHLSVLLAAQCHVDSAVSKTVNVGERVTFDEFKSIYTRAYDGGAKGLATFRLNGKRSGIFESTAGELSPNHPDDEGAACTFDPETGRRTCDS